MEMQKLSTQSLYVKTYGRLDIDDAMKYGLQIKEKVEAENITELTWDFSSVTFISSFGLKVILEIYQAMEAPADIKIINASDVVKKSFAIVNFGTFINVI